MNRSNGFLALATTLRKGEKPGKPFTQKNSYLFKIQTNKNLNKKGNSKIRSKIERREYEKKNIFKTPKTSNTQSFIFFSTPFYKLPAANFSFEYLLFTYIQPRNFDMLVCLLLEISFVVLRFLRP